MNAASLQLEHLSYHYGSTLALNDIRFNVQAGELITLVGPSGCGKSTLLRLIAGLLTPSSGRLRIDNQDVSRLATEKRAIGWVPQSYGLFEHLNVADNVAFGLKMRGEPVKARKQVVTQMLELCRIPELATRPVSALSGGQRQRVAIARALAVSPRVLLLDEPLAALDPQLRLELRGNLVQLLRESGVTTVFVTHDQEEALALADRVVVMRAGHIEQVASPETLWQAPASQFVAEFVGNAVVLSGKRVADNRLELFPGFTVPYVNNDEDDVLIALRMNDVCLATDGAPATVRSVAYAGGRYHVTVETEDGSRLHAHSNQRPDVLEQVHIAFCGSQVTCVG